MHTTFYYMTGVFPQRLLVDSGSRGVQYVVILHGVQYVVILHAVQYVVILNRGQYDNEERMSIRSYETQRMLY